MSVLLYIYTKMFGKFIGYDEFGNRYYSNNKRQRTTHRECRWVIYHKNTDPTNKWFSWLHHQSDIPPTSSSLLYRNYHLMNKKLFNCHNNDMKCKKGTSETTVQDHSMLQNRKYYTCWESKDDVQKYN